MGAFLEFFKKNKDVQEWYETGLQSFGNNWYVLGPMVTGPIDQGAIEIYDGQQRTTTLTLLFLAIRDAASYIERVRKWMYARRQNTVDDVPCDVGQLRYQHPGNMRFPGMDPDHRDGEDRPKFARGNAIPIDTLAKLSAQLQRLVVDEDQDTDSDYFLRLKIKHENNLQRLQYLVGQPSMGQIFPHIRARENVTIPGGKGAVAGAVIQVEGDEPESNRLLGGGTPKIYAVYDYFLRKTREFFDSYGVDTPILRFTEDDGWVDTGQVGRYLTDEQFSQAASEFNYFVQSILHASAVSVTNVRDDVTAYQVFLTLNTKGAPLSIFDLFRAAIFARFKANENLLNSFRVKFSSVDNHFIDGADDNFFRYSWIAMVGKKLTKSEVCSSALSFVRNTETTSDDILAFCDRMIVDATNIKNITMSKHIDEACFENEMVDLNKGTGMKQYIPLLLNVWRHYPDQYLWKRAYIKFSLIVFLRRLAFEEGSPSAIEKFMAEVAGKVTGDGQDFNHIVQFSQLAGNPLHNFTKESFVERLREFNPQYGEHTDLIRLLLRLVTIKINNGALLSSSGIVNLEHVYPQNPKEEDEEYWAERFPEDVGGDILHTMGNLIPLHSPLNKAAKNKRFELKKEDHYRQDPLGIATHLLNHHDDWDETTVVWLKEYYQQQLAEIFSPYLVEDPT